MEVTWWGGDGAGAVLDSSGRVGARGDALLRRELHDERLAVVTLLGPRATVAARRRVAAQMLGRQPEPDESVSDGVALLAWGTHIENDYTLLVLDADVDTAGDSVAALVGALCALSSLVVSVTDSVVATHALPAFAPFQDTLRVLQRDHAAVEIYDLLPTMQTVAPTPTSTRDATMASSSLADLIQLKVLGERSVEAFTSADGPKFLAAHARVKKLFGGAELTGELLLSVIQTIARDVADGHEPDLSSAWDEFAERKCTAVAEDAIATYVDCIQSSLGVDVPPIELDAFEKLHDELSRLAMDVFHNGTSTRKAPSRRTVRDHLKRDLKQKYSDELKALREHSRRFCDCVRAELWRELSGPLIVERATATEGDVLNGDNSAESSSVSFRAALDAIQRFDALYSERARGPEKASVLIEFYKRDAVEVFRRLESIVSRRMTDAHLRELREQLEKDFETKKDALVTHFKQEEAQLRVCMTREMEMMQKLHQAKTSRAKIDESETKRLRDEVVELRNAKAELESRQVILEHSSESTSQHNKALEAKVRDLEHSVRHEMASRAELVDTLAATIKAGEENERQLQDRIGELQIEVKEKASRIENELRDLTLQLRKTSEEKDELQKKLNEFFLRVTALPAALQEHLFCADTGDGKPVGFADALSSYMSE